MHVDIALTGGVVDARIGSPTMTTKARVFLTSDDISVSVTLRNQPGGEVYDVVGIGSVRGPVGLALLNGRREVASTTGADANGNPSGAGTVNACLPPVRPANCIDASYGERNYSGAIGAFASVRQDLVGSPATGLVDATANTSWNDGNGGATVADAVVMFTAATAAVPVRVTLRCAAGGEAFVGRQIGNQVLWQAYVSGQPNPGFPLFTDPNVEWTWGGGEIVTDVYAAPGETYRISLSRSLASGTCSYDADFGDDIVYE